MAVPFMGLPTSLHLAMGRCDCRAKNEGALGARPSAPQSTEGLLGSPLAIASFAPSAVTSGRERRFYALALALWPRPRAV
jgi:hypothetical protein